MDQIDSFAALLAIMPAAPAFADNAPASPLAASLDVGSVETKADGSVVISAAGTSAPGKILQYTGHYKNVSTAPLAGLIVNGQIPANTVFLPAGLSASAPATFEVLVAGEPWQGLPAYKHVKHDDGSVARVEALPADYQQLRWRITDPLQPGVTFVSVYRVQISK